MHMHGLGLTKILRASMEALQDSESRTLRHLATCRILSTARVSDLSPRGQQVHLLHRRCRRVPFLQPSESWTVMQQEETGARLDELPLGNCKCRT